MEPLVKVLDLQKKFTSEQNPALDTIQFSLFPGKIVGLVGPDGAGKTTLIRLMAGLLKPTGGSIKILGYDTLQDAENIYDCISYMPQRFGLYEDLSVLQNLQLYADLYGLDEKEKDEKFSSLLKFTNLASFTKRLAKNLSGGMKQKLGLACTLLRKPKLLLLDEPTAGVDPISRRELWEMVTQLIQEEISVLWSTAYLDEAEKCQEVILLNQGKLLYQGAPETLSDKLMGRTFQIQNITKDRREVLGNALLDPDVVDGVIQGDSVRIVLRKERTSLDMQKFDPGKDAFLKEVPPRFEDAFMDILKGKPEGKSPLIQLMPQLENDHQPIMEIQGLKKCFGSFTAVDHVSFSVKKGEIFGLLGPNGAGKSTIFKMICGLITPTEGDVVIDGISIKTMKSKAREKIGYMAQKFSLYENMTVRQNMHFFSGIYPESGKEISQDLIHVFDLENFADTKSSELPIGFKQRLALSCALMHKPKVLFLDEPTSGVDPITRREFWSHINGMVQKGISVIITTHFMDEAEYCDRIGLINNGKLISVGTPDELKRSVKCDACKEPTLEDAFIILSSKTPGAKDA